MKKIICLLLILFSCIYINSMSNKTIITESRKYYAVPSTCTEQNNCEKLLINDTKWFTNWRENEATIMPDGQPRSYANVLFLIDVSGSMYQNSQLYYVSEVIKKFNNSLKDEDMMGIAIYSPIVSSGVVEFKSAIKKTISKDKFFDENIFSTININDFLQSQDNAFKYLSSQMVPTSNWSYDIIIWLTDSFDDSFFEQMAGGKSLLDYGIKLYMVNIGNEQANVNYFGSKTKETYGKYYFVDLKEEIQPVNQCNEKSYAEANPGTCCTEYPETCCNNKEFIDNNWNTFTGEREWYKTYCCSKENFKNNNPDKCSVETKVETPVCEGESDFCSCLLRLFIFLGHIMNIIKISVPIIIILLGSIDLIKAMIAQNDDEIKKAKNKFIKRLIYAVIVFFVISIVSFLIGLAGGDTNNRCFKCVADVNGKACDKENIPVCCRK